MKTLNDDFKAELIGITELSNKINNNDNRKIVQMMKEHIDEIIDRYLNEDEHWAIETADLIVLCYELLLSEDKDIDDVFSICLPRFDKKLYRLVKNAN
jgi:hypothetical protein